MIIKKNTNNPGCIISKSEFYSVVSEESLPWVRTKILSDYYFFPLLYINILLENGNLLRYSCLKNSMDRGAWWAAVHWDAKSRTGLSNWAHTHSTSLCWLRRCYKQTVRATLQLLCSSCGSCSFSLCLKQVICWLPQF